MFSRIDNIQGPPRRAEATDGRMDVERHDEDYIRRKKKKQEEKPDLLDRIEDGTSVSTEAVLSFLKGFIANMPDVKATAPVIDTTPHDFTSHNQAAPQGPIDPQALRASRAYQTTARAVHDRYAPATQTAADQGAAEALLGSEDVRTIYRLIDDLKILIDKNIQNLALERAPTFLASLVNAVQKATP